MTMVCCLLLSCVVFANDEMPTFESTTFVGFTQQDQPNSEGMKQEQDGVLLPMNHPFYLHFSIRHVDIPYLGSQGGVLTIEIPSPFTLTETDYDMSPYFSQWDSSALKEVTLVSKGESKGGSLQLHVMTETVEPDTDIYIPVKLVVPIEHTHIEFKGIGVKQDKGYTIMTARTTQAERQQDASVEGNTETASDTSETDIGSEDSVTAIAPTTTVEQVVEMEMIPYQTTRIEDDTKFIGEEVIQQPGKAGKKEVTYAISYQNGVEVSRQVIQETVIDAPIEQVITYGVKSKEQNRDKLEVVMEEIPFTVEYEADPDIPTSIQDIVIQKGQKGKRETTYRIVYRDGKEVSKEKIKDVMIQSPVPEKRKYGTKENGEKKKAIHVVKEEVTDTTKRPLPNTGEETSQFVMAMLFLWLGSMCYLTFKTTKH